MRAQQTSRSSTHRSGGWQSDRRTATARPLSGATPSATQPSPTGRQSTGTAPSTPRVDLAPGEHAPHLRHAR